MSTEGYCHCACFDCFEIAIGKRGVALCFECRECGCVADDGDDSHGPCYAEEKWCLENPDWATRETTNGNT